MKFFSFRCATSVETWARPKPLKKASFSSVNLFNIFSLIITTITRFSLHLGTLRCWSILGTSLFQYRASIINEVPMQHIHFICCHDIEVTKHKLFIEPITRNIEHSPTPPVSRIIFNRTSRLKDLLQKNQKYALTLTPISKIPTN